MRKSYGMKRPDIPLKVEEINKTHPESMLDTFSKILAELNGGALSFQTFYDLFDGIFTDETYQKKATPSVKAQAFLCVINWPGIASLRKRGRLWMFSNRILCVPQDHRWEIFEGFLSSKYIETLLADTPYHLAYALKNVLFSLPQDRFVTGYISIIRSDAFKGMAEEFRRAFYSTVFKDYFDFDRKDVVLLVEQDTLTLSCPKGSVNPEYGVVFKFSCAANAKEDLTFIGGCEQSWFEGGSLALFDRYDGRSDRPYQCYKISKAFEMALEAASEQGVSINSDLKAGLKLELGVLRQNNRHDPDHLNYYEVEPCVIEHI